MTTIEPTRSEIAGVLDKAVTVLETNGWHQGYLYDEIQAEEQALQDCRVCAIGAIYTAVYGQPRFDFGPAATRNAARGYAAIDEVRGHVRALSLVEWSDHPKRTVDDVIQAFRDTAAELRAGVAA